MDLLMEKGAGAEINHPKHDLFHGMVSKQSESVSSSKKNALLIDELAEWIDGALEEEDERAGVRERHPVAEAIVPQVALGYFLMHTNTKPLDFEPEKLLRPEQSLGWDLARARAHNGNGSGSAPAEPAADPDYRFAVVQSEMYRRHLMQAVERLDVSPLARYVSHLSRWYLESDREPHVQAATQAALAQGARGLGLETMR
jgi:arginyl-tRNA synthetase